MNVGTLPSAPPAQGLRCEDGSLLPLPVERWLSEPTVEEEELLDRAVGPVLDVGCGPARHVAALLRRGIPAVGIDPAPSAVELARRRGAPALRRSVFGPLPQEGRWATALLLDGNIGIGGSPTALLARLRALLRPEGRVLTEVEPPGGPTAALRVRIELGERATAWFPWARVGADALAGLARGSGFRVAELWSRYGRWFATLDAR